MLKTWDEVLEEFRVLFSGSERYRALWNNQEWLITQLMTSENLPDDVSPYRSLGTLILYVGSSPRRIDIFSDEPNRFHIGIHQYSGDSEIFTDEATVTSDEIVATVKQYVNRLKTNRGAD